MNTVNNARNRKTEDDIRKAYLNLVISRSDVSSITVSDICKKAGINRTTFYAHYLDIDDMKDSICDWMMNEFLSVFSEEIAARTHSYDFLKLFRNIYENQIFYRIYFKLGFDFRKTFLDNGSSAAMSGGFSKYTDNIDYHIEFFSAGITAIVRKWLDGGCHETPEAMAKVIYDEYSRDTL